MRMSPASGRTVPAISRSSVVLPLPDGPQTTTVSPLSTVSDTPSSTAAPR